MLLPRLVGSDPVVFRDHERTRRHRREVLRLLGRVRVLLPSKPPFPFPLSRLRLDLYVYHKPGLRLRGIDQLFPFPCRHHHRIRHHPRLRFPIIILVLMQVLVLV